MVDQIVMIMGQRVDQMTREELINTVIMLAEQIRGTHAAVLASHEFYRELRAARDRRG